MKSVQRRRASPEFPFNFSIRTDRMYLPESASKFQVHAGYHVSSHVVQLPLLRIFSTKMRCNAMLPTWIQTRLTTMEAVCKTMLAFQISSSLTACDALCLSDLFLLGQITVTPWISSKLLSPSGESSCEPLSGATGSDVRIIPFLRHCIAQMA